MNPLKMALGLSLLFAVGASAQPRDAWAGVAQLAQGSEIRVTLMGGRALRGFLQSASADGLTINATTSQEMLARTAIQRIELKRPGHRGRNTLLGLGVGAGVGLAVGAALDAAVADNYIRDAGKVVFTPIGLVLGTVIGVAWPTGGWRSVYSAP